VLYLDKSQLHNREGKLWIACYSDLSAVADRGNCRGPRYNPDILEAGCEIVLKAFVIKYICFLKNVILYIKAMTQADQLHHPCQQENFWPLNRSSTVRIYRARAGVRSLREDSTQFWSLRCLLKKADALLSIISGFGAFLKIVFDWCHVAPLTWRLLLPHVVFDPCATTLTLLLLLHIVRSPAPARSCRAPFHEGPRRAPHSWPRQVPPHGGPRRAPHLRPHRAAPRGGLCQAPHSRAPSSSPSNTHVELTVEVLLHYPHGKGLFPIAISLPSPGSSSSSKFDASPPPTLSLYVCVPFTLKISGWQVFDEMPNRSFLFSALQK
jgi:hypothetical protein